MAAIHPRQVSGQGGSLKRPKVSPGIRFLDPGGALNRSSNSATLLLAGHLGAQAFAPTKRLLRGDVVIPDEIRSQTGLKPGSQFAVICRNAAGILKVISPPSFDEYADLKRRLRRKACDAGLKRRVISRAIAEVRGHS